MPTVWWVPGGGLDPLHEGRNAPMKTSTNAPNDWNTRHKCVKYTQHNGYVDTWTLST